MMRFVKGVVHRLGKAYCRKICRSEFESQSFRWINERPIEFRFLFDRICRSNAKTVLDVGTGTTSLPRLLRTCGYLVTATDNIRDYWPDGMTNRHYHVVNDDITATNIRESFDFVTCISVVEHIRNHTAAVRNMIKLLNENGSLIVTCPYSEQTYIANVYDLPDAGYGKDNPYICQSFSRMEINSWLEDSGAQIVAQEYWQVFTGEYWTVGEKLRIPVQVTKNDRHQLTCIHLKKTSMN